MSVKKHTIQMNMMSLMCGMAMCGMNFCVGKFQKTERAVWIV